MAGFCRIFTGRGSNYWARRAYLRPQAARRPRVARSRAALQQKRARCSIRPMEKDFIEREYNNRELVPDHAAYFARWERDSQFVRETLPGHLDLAYGPDPRHRIDFFPAARARGTLLFLHGGYWRSLDKTMFSWLAAAYVAARVGVALAD